MKNGIYVLYSTLVTAALLYIGDTYGTSNMFLVIGCIIAFYFINQGALFLSSLSFNKMKKTKTENKNHVENIDID